MTEQYDGELATQYTAMQQNFHPINALTHPTALRECGDLRGKRVLDLACGSGYSSRLLAASGALVIGVDISADMIALAEAQGGDIQYIRANAMGLHLHMPLFDVVTASFLFHYANTIQRLDSMVHTATRHLKRGGKLVSLNTPPDPICPQMPNMGHWSEWVEGDKPYVEGSRVRLQILGPSGEEACKPLEYYYWAQQTYDGLLTLAGFDHIRWVPHTFPRELRDKYDNWPALEAHNASCVVTAIKL